MLNIRLLICALLLGIQNIAISSQPPSEPFLRIDTGKHSGAIRQIGVDREKKWLLTTSTDKTGRLWNLSNGELIQVFRPPIGTNYDGILQAGDLSPDGRWVALAGVTGYEWDKSVSIYVFESTSGSIKRRLTRLPEAVTSLSFSSDGKFLAAGLKGFGGLRIWRTDTWELIGEDKKYGGDIYGLAFNPINTRLATTSWDGDVRLYEIQAYNLKLIKKNKAPSGKHPFRIKFDTSGSKIALGHEYMPRIDILDAHTLEHISSPDISALGEVSLKSMRRAGGKGGSLGAVDWGDLLVAGGRWWSEEFGNSIIKWDPKENGEAQEIRAAQQTIFDVIDLRDSRIAWASGEPSWGVSSYDNKSIFKTSQSIANFTNLADDFKVDQSGRIIRFGYDYGGNEPAAFDINNLRFVNPNERSLAPAITDGLIIHNWKNDLNPSLAGNKINIYKNEASRSLAIRPDLKGFVLGTEHFLRYYDSSGNNKWSVVATGAVWAVNIPSTSKIVVAAYGDGTIRWHRLSDGKELLAFFPHADRKRWVLWTPKGYFVASEGAEDLIGWHLNQGKDKEARFVTGAQLYNALYRPDLIQRVVDGEDPDNLPPMSVAELVATGASPSVEILSPTAKFSADRDIAFRFRVCDAGGGIGKHVLRLNNVAIGAADPRAVKIVGKESGEGCVNEEIMISLQPGENRISITAFNKQGVIESLPAEQIVTFAGKATGKPHLHVLALAVDQYRDGDLRLAYSKKDADGLLERLKVSAKDLFLEIKISKLYDDSVRVEQVTQAFDRIAKEVGPDDVFMLFIAGHGVTDRADGNYYYLPVNFRYNDDNAVRQQGISNQFFQTNLAKIKAGKSVVLLDTCNSGGFGELRAKARGVEEKTAVTRLVKATGRATIMASASNQVALEGYKGHGVFTWALLEGLKGKAAGKDRQITVSGLADYVAEVVPELTYKQFGYEQVPQREMRGMNFPIGVVK
ncbi:MAG: hypothetical protein FJ220_02965 [Kiritimatiellaceae bacterium]|nr:hypothetical protein [Kiritimatiellaceae bacterium]